MIRFTVLITLASLSVFLTPSCSSNDNGEKKKRSAGAETRLEDRLGKWDMSRRSSFEGTNKSYKTDRDFKTGTDYRTKDFNQNKSFYSGKKEIKEDSFSQADKKSRASGSTFSGADDRAREGEQTFATRSSRYDNQENRNSGRLMRGNDAVYRTRNDPVASDAMATSKRPYINQSNNPSYTEGEVRSILNK